MTRFRKQVSGCAALVSGRGRRVVAVVGVALIAVSPALAAGRLAKPGTIRITDQQVRHAHVDVGRRGVSGGDLDLFRVVLFNRRITAKPIGHAEMVCTYTGSSSWSCAATYFLPKGKIVAGGVIGSPLIYELAVLGGTGLYANVRGTLTVTSLARRPPRALLVFRLQV